MGNCWRRTHLITSLCSYGLFMTPRSHQLSMTCDFVYTCIYAWLIYYTPLGHFLYLLSKELFFQLEDILRVSTMRTIYIYLFRYAHPFIAGRYLQKRPKRESRQNQQRICQRPGFRSSAGKSFHYSLKCIYVSDHLKSCQIEDIHFRFWKFPFLCIWGGLQSLWSPSVPVSVPSLPPSLLYSYRHLSRSVWTVFLQTWDICKEILLFLLAGSKGR